MPIEGIRQILRITEKGAVRTEDTILEEVAFRLLYNDKEKIRIRCTPEDLDRLAVGWLYCSGDIASIDDIDMVDVDFGMHEIRAKGNDHEGGGRPGNRSRRKIPNLITPEQIHNIFHRFQTSCDLFIRTGGCHSCAAMPLEAIQEFDGPFPILKYDVARRNALEKAVGEIIYKRLEPESFLLIFSGRLAFEIVKSIANIGTPLVLAAGAPTLPSLDIAEESNITLAGFIDAKKINVYTHSWRVKIE